jgi:hypothetical protein
MVGHLAQVTAAAAASVADTLTPSAPVQTAGSAAQGIASIIYTATQSTQHRTGFDSPDGKAIVQLALLFAALGFFVVLLKSESRPRSWTTLLYTPPA